MFTKFAIAIAALIALVLIPGCGTTSSTTSRDLSSGTVAKIVKGTTTRADIEKMFGPPDTVVLAGNGQHQLIYQNMQTKTDMSGMLVQTAIPFGGLVPMHNKDTVNKQMLEVLVDANGIVVDYDFSDSTSNSDTTASVFGAHTETTVTTPNK